MTNGLYWQFSISKACFETPSLSVSDPLRNDLLTRTGAGSAVVGRELRGSQSRRLVEARCGRVTWPWLALVHVEIGKHHLSSGCRKERSGKALGNIVEYKEKKGAQAPTTQ
jgi:hypothetical protein